MPLPHPSLRLADERHHAGPQHRVVPDAQLHQYCPVGGSLLQQVLDAGDDVLVLGVRLGGRGEDLRELRQPRHSGRRLLYETPRPLVPVVRRSHLAPRQRTVEPRRPLLVQVDVRLRQGRDPWRDRNLRERIEWLTLTLHHWWSLSSPDSPDSPRRMVSRISP